MESLNDHRLHYVTAYSSSMVDPADLEVGPFLSLEVESIGFRKPEHRRR